MTSEEYERYVEEMSKPYVDENYLVVAINEEAGEIAGWFKKYVLRGNPTEKFSEDDLKGELAKITGRLYKDIKIEVNALFSKYSACQICGSTERLCVDHNHDTGKMRGILCLKCNSSLGFLKENQDALRNAIRYLMRSEREARCA